MFIMTAINLLLSSIHTGAYVAAFIMAVREFLILDIDYPLSKKPDLVKGVIQSMVLVTFWTSALPVSIKLSLPDPVSIHAWRRFCSVISLSSGGLVPSSPIDSG